MRPLVAKTQVGWEAAGRWSNTRGSAGWVCESCGKTSAAAWRGGGKLCCECGLNDELFRPETRWLAAEFEAHRSAAKAGAARARPSPVLRLGLKSLGAIAPRAAAELGARMFFSPRRARRWTAPNVPIPGNVFRFSVGEWELACWSWGRGPVVILVHGWEGYAAQLTHFVQPLIGAGFRVVAFDMPAHGASTGRRLSAFGMAEAIHAVASAFSPVWALVAHSLGGTASIFAMSQGLEIKRVALLAPAAEPTHFARRLASWLGFSKARAAGMLERIEHRLGMRLEEAGVLPLVPTMRARLLLMHDPEDPEVPFDHGKAIAEAWPGARLELLSQMGHRAMLRDPSTIASVAAFIARPDVHQELPAPARTGY